MGDVAHQEPHCRSPSIRDTLRSITARAAKATSHARQRGTRTGTRGAQHGIVHILQAQTGGGKCSNISRKRQQHAEAACSASRHGWTTTNIMHATIMHKSCMMHHAAGPNPEAGIAPCARGPEPCIAAAKRRRISLISATLFRWPQPAANKQHESQQPEIWRQNGRLEGQGVDRARWLGMEKVRRVQKECGVALTGSGGLGHVG